MEPLVIGGGGCP